MRLLNDKEISDMVAIDVIGPDYPGKFIEAKVSELAQMNIGTACGGPDTFKILDNKYSHRKVRGYLVENCPDIDSDRSYLIGMICIKIQTEATAEKIEMFLGNNGSYLRFDSQADPDTTLNGFMIFEDE